MLGSSSGRNPGTLAPAIATPFHWGRVVIVLVSHRSPSVRALPSAVIPRKVAWLAGATLALLLVGVALAGAASAAEGTVFHPIDPIRAFDSRVSAYPQSGTLAPNQSKVIPVKDGHDFFGNVLTPNAVPVGATAVSYNITIVAPTGPNFVSVTPGDATLLTTSAINFDGSSDIANAGIVTVDSSRQVKVWNGIEAGSVHFIVDVTGYYLPDPRFADVTRATVQGEDTLTFSGMNLQVVNGTGSTGGTPNGEGNVIIGYNTSSGDDKSGSHNLVVGDLHTYSQFAGIVAGQNHSNTGSLSSLVGGDNNTATGTSSFIGGGANNTAGGNVAFVGGSIIGGNSNSASGNSSFAGGGEINTANGIRSFVGGGNNNIADGNESFVGGGAGNTATPVNQAIAGNHRIGTDWWGKVSADSGGANLLSGNGVTSVNRLLTGQFQVSFASAITGCGWMATLNDNDAGVAPSGQISIERDSSADAVTLRVRTFNASGAAADPASGDGFTVQVDC